MKNDDLEKYIFSDNDVFYYSGGYQYLRVFYYLRSINKNIILLTTKRGIYDYAKSIKIPVYFFKPIELDLNIKNPLNCVRYLFELIKYKKRVQDFINKYEGAKIFHNVECVDICFLYFIKKCRETYQIKTYKFHNQVKLDFFNEKSFKNKYFILYPWLYSSIFGLGLTAKKVSGEPLICATKEYSNIQLNLNLNKIKNISQIVDSYTQKDHEVSKKIFFILGHSFKADSYYYDEQSLRYFYEFFHKKYSNILYKIHPGYPDYFSSMKSCSFQDSIDYFEYSNLPIESIKFSNCVIISLNSYGIVNLKANQKSFYLIDLINKSDLWDHKSYKSWLYKLILENNSDVTFIKTYEQLTSEIDVFLKNDNE